MPFIKRLRHAYFILFAGFISYVLTISVYSFLFRHTPTRNIFDLQFLYGPLVKNIVTLNIYASPGMQFTGHRLPFIPYFLSAIAIIHNDIIFAYVVKNLIFYSVTFIAMRFWWVQETGISKQLKLVVVAFVAFFPPLIFWGTSPDADEGYIIHFMATLSIGLFFFERMELRRKWIMIVLLGFLNALLYLTKSSMLLPSAAICFLFWLKSAKLKVFSVFVVIFLSSLIFWGLMNIRHSGTFAITTSLDGWNLYKGNNELTLSLYPPYNLDILDMEKLLPFKRPSGMNEWEFNDAARNKAVEFAMNNPMDELRLIGRRLFIFFFEVRRNPLYRGETQFESPVYWVSAIWMTVFRLILFGSLFGGVKCLSRHIRGSTPQLSRHAKNTIIYFLILASYAVPCIIGFAYERHLMPLVIPTVIYFFSTAYPELRSSPAQVDRRSDHSV